MAKIVAVGNQKGGCGKTTVTMQLAGAFSRQVRVLVVDADPQGTATRWASRAPEGKDFPATISGLAAAGAKIHREIQKVLADYDLVIVDCPPAVESPITQSVFLVADLGLLPVIPSPPDLWAAVGIRTLVEQIQPLNESLKVRLVANMVQTTTLSKEVVELFQDFRIPLLPTHVGHRTAYRMSATCGTSVHTLKDPKAIEEVERLASEVAALLDIRYKRYIPRTSKKSAR